jgi:hypothetical protein
VLVTPEKTRTIERRAYKPKAVGRREPHARKQGDTSDENRGLTQQLATASAEAKSQAKTKRPGRKICRAVSFEPPDRARQTQKRLKRAIAGSRKNQCRK